MMKMKQRTPAPKYFSYIRYSTAIQEHGDSERRQIALADGYAKKNGIQFDDKLKFYDRGISGFQGQHRKSGALASFLKEVEKGNVPTGSTLVVENIDRLGREGASKALKNVILQLIENGITIQTLSPEETYNEESIDQGMIWQLVGHVQRANAESKLKSQRVGAAWYNKKKLAQKGIILTKRAPAWLRIEKDNDDKDKDRFVAIPEAKKTIRQIFKLKLSGLGKESIAKKLNASAAWMPPRNPNRKSFGWRASYITKLLSYRALLGEYQPYKGTHKLKNRVPDGDPIVDYYPSIIKPDVFFAVKKQLQVNKGKGGEIGKATNLFVHIVFCAYCGGPMVLLNKGSNNKYLTCDVGRRGVHDEKGNTLCKSYSISYDETEDAVLKNCAGLRPEQVLPNPGEQADEITRLQTKLAGIVGNIEDIEKRITNLVDAVEQADTKEVRDRFTTRIQEYEGKKASLNTKREETEVILESAERSQQNVKQWKRDLKNLRSSLAKGGVDIRLQMRSHLRELIDKIEVFAVGFTKCGNGELVKKSRRRKVRRRVEKRSKTVTTDVYEEEKDVENLADHIHELVAELNPIQLKSTEFKEFCDWVTKRRMSRYGRFIRIHFKTKIRRDIVPGDSIASGRGLEIDEDGKIGWTIKQPKFDQLRNRYKSWKRHQ